MSDAREIVEELSRRFGSGDREGALKLYHRDLRIQQPSSLPHGGWHRGVDGMARMAAEFGRHWDRTIEDPRIIGGDATSAVQLTTQTWTAKATARSATVDVVELFTVTDGFISEIRVFQQDTYLLLGTLEPG